MKKKSLLLTLLPTLLFSLVGCNQNDSRIKLTYGNIHTYQYRDVYEVKEFKYSELEDVVEKKESFILFVYEVCGCWDTFQPVLVEFMNEYHIDVKYIFADEIRTRDNKFGLSLPNGSMPTIAFFNNGVLKKQLNYFTAPTKELKNCFSNYNSFKKYINSNVIMPKMYYIDQDVLDNKIANNDTFDIYFMRNKCGDCKDFAYEILRGWNSTIESVNNPLYIFDLQPIKDEDEEKYQTTKDDYKLSCKYNETFGYDIPSFFSGAVPAIQHRKGDEIKDMMVALNDFVNPETKKMMFTYFTKERVSHLSFLNGTGNKYVLENREFTQKEVEDFYSSTRLKIHKEIANLYLKTYIK